MKINLGSITVMLGLLAIASILVPTQMQTQTFASTDEPDVLNIREVGNNGNNAEMVKMSVKEGNQPSQKEDGFELDPEENAIYVPQGKNVEVTNDEDYFRTLVVKGDNDKQIPVSPQGVVDLKGLAQGFYYFDAVIQDGNTKVAYEAILYIGPRNTQSEDTVNKEINRVDKDVTITKRITNIDRTVVCGKDQKFNDRTKKCENIPPPCIKPNVIVNGKCVPPKTMTPTPPTECKTGEIMDKTGKCVPTQISSKTPTPPQPQGPGESCTLADGRPGRVTGTQAQGNLNCVSTADNRGATTAPTGPAGSDCTLPGGNTGGKVTNTPNGLACIAGTKPPTPPSPKTPTPPAPAGGGPTEPRAPAGTTPGSVDPNIAPTLNPVCKPGQQSTPQAPCKPGITVPGPGQPGSPGGPPDATGFQRLPDGTLVFPKGTQQVVCPQPQSSGAQCVKLPASLGGLTIPVMGLTTRPDGSLSQAPAPSLTGPGGPLDPNNPPGKVFPECPPGGPITSDCVAGPNTFKTPQAGPAPGAQPPIAALSPAPAPAPGQTPQTGPAAGTGVPPGPVQGPPPVPDSPADAWPVGTTLTRYPDGTLVAAPPGGKAIMLKPTASGGIYMPSQNPDGTINIASPLGFQVKPGSVNIAPSGLDPAQGRPVPVESLPKATTTAPAQPAATPVEPTEPGGTGEGTGGGALGFVAPPPQSPTLTPPTDIPTAEQLVPGTPPSGGEGTTEPGTTPPIDTFCQDPANANEPECREAPPTDTQPIPLTPPPTETETPTEDPDAALFGPDPGTEPVEPQSQAQGTTDRPMTENPLAGDPCPEPNEDQVYPNCPEPIPDPTPEPQPYTCEDGTVVMIPGEDCPGDEPPTPSPQPQPGSCEENPNQPKCDPPDCENFPDDPRCPRPPVEPVDPLPGQTLAETTPTGILCPDGVTTAPTEDDCPDTEPTTQTCSDGSVIPVDQACPEPQEMQTCADGSVIAADEECPDLEELEQAPMDEQFEAAPQDDFSSDLSGGDGGDAGDGGEGDGGDAGSSDFEGSSDGGEGGDSEE